MCKIVALPRDSDLFLPERHSYAPEARARSLAWNTNNAGPMHSRVKQGLSIYADRFNISARLRNGRCRAFTLELCTCSSDTRGYLQSISRCEIPLRGNCLFRTLSAEPFILLLMRQTRLPYGQIMVTNTYYLLFASTYRLDVRDERYNNMNALKLTIHRATNLFQIFCLQN